MRRYSKIIPGFAALVLALLLYSCGDCVIMSVDEVPPSVSINVSASMIFRNENVSVDLAVSDDYLIKCVEVNLNGNIYKVLKEEDWSFELPSDDLEIDDNLIEAIVYDSFNNPAKDSARVRIFDDLSLSLAAEDTIFFGNDLIVNLSAAAKDSIETLSYSVWKGADTQGEAILNDSLELEQDLQFFNGEVIISSNEYEIGDYSYKFVLITNTGESISETGQFSVIEVEEDIVEGVQMNLNEISEVLK